jgi:hypothetical protein
MSRLAFTLAVIVLAIGAKAGAQSPVSDAREAFVAGESAFEAGDYETALERFRRAFELSPHDAVRFNIAVCYEHLSRLRDALSEYESAARSSVLDEAWRSRARAQAERVREGLAILIVSGTRTGAAVIVDGEERCASPCTAEIDPRASRVVVRDAEGEETREIAPERGETIRWELAARPRPASPAPAPREYTIGPLFWIGAGTIALGAGGIIGFGLRAQNLHAAYETRPLLGYAREGEIMQGLANASIGVAALGAVLVLIDLAILANLDL